MSTKREPHDNPSEPLRITLKSLAIVVAFGAAFGYIEAAVVVYLREIFHPDGFTFPMRVFGLGPSAERMLLTEIGREAATIVLIFTSAWLFGRNRRRQVAYFLVIFAVWDIFYYVWLKVLLDWPATLFDWDILFLTPLPWASPVLAPLLTSAAMLAFAWLILHRDCLGRPIQATATDWLAFCACIIVVVSSLCTAGPHITEGEYAEHFFWPLFLAPLLVAVAVFIRCFLKSR